MALPLRLSIAVRAGTALRPHRLPRCGDADEIKHMKDTSFGRQANPRDWGKNALSASRRITILCMIAFMGTVSGHAGESSRWWPVQALPTGVVRTEVVEKSPERRASME